MADLQKKIASQPTGPPPKAPSYQSPPGQFFSIDEEIIVLYCSFNIYEYSGLHLLKTNQICITNKKLLVEILKKQLVWCLLTRNLSILILYLSNEDSIQPRATDNSFQFVQWVGRQSMQIILSSSIFQQQKGRNYDGIFLLSNCSHIKEKTTVHGRN